MSDQSRNSERKVWGILRPIRPLLYRSIGPIPERPQISCARFCAHRFCTTIQNDAVLCGSLLWAQTRTARALSPAPSMCYLRFRVPFATQRSGVRSSCRPPAFAPDHRRRLPPVARSAKRFPPLHHSLSSLHAAAPPGSYDVKSPSPPAALIGHGVLRDVRGEILLEGASYRLIVRAEGSAGALHPIEGTILNPPVPWGFLSRPLARSSFSTSPTANRGTGRFRLVRPGRDDARDVWDRSCRRH